MRNVFLLVMLALMPAAAHAQRRAIHAGMTEAQVRSAFGDPARVRSSGAWSYLFYANGCAPRCGSDDVVFLEDGRVVAAVLRTRTRTFAGPAADRALGTLKGSGAEPAPSPAPRRTGARVKGVRLQVPGSEGMSVGGKVPPEQPTPSDRGARVPLAPPDTIDFSLPSDTPRVAPERPVRVEPRPR